MNKTVKNTFGLVVLLSSVFFLSSCGEPEETGPSNVVSDDTGIKIDLDWTTGGSVNTAITDTDLDLYIYKNGSKVFSGTNSGFEQIKINSNLHADGTYTVAIYSYKVNKNTTYTVTIDGQSVSKPYTFNSTYASGDTQHEINVLTIVKSGGTYTTSTVN